MHVPDKELEQFLDQYMERDSAVLLAQAKSQDSDFNHLYSGNRYCYAKRIMTPIPRFTSFLIPDPMDLNSANPHLMEIDMTIYHDDQPINCRKCKDLSHTFQDCPKRQKPFSFQQRKCFLCGLPGHIAKSCGIGSPKASTDQQDHSLDKFLSESFSSTPGISFIDSQNDPACSQGPNGLESTKRIGDSDASENNSHLQCDRPSEILREEPRSLRSVSRNPTSKLTSSNPVPSKVYVEKPKVNQQPAARPKRPPPITPPSGEKDTKKQPQKTGMITNWYAKGKK